MKNYKRENKENGRTELVFVLDRSGSMWGLEADTVGGFNSMIEKQKKLEGEVKVTTVLFNHDMEYIHDRFDIEHVKKMQVEDFEVGGTTAMLDAIGSAIQKQIAVQKNLPEEARSAKVIFVIITDGYENSSREYTYDNIRKMISLEQEKYGWEFLFLGANIDAVSEGAKFGIRADRAVRYKNDSQGTELNYEVVGDAISSLRAAGHVEETWMAPIQEDVRKRGE